MIIQTAYYVLKCIIIIILHVLLLKRIILKYKYIIK